MVIKRYKNNISVSKVNRVKDNTESNNRQGGDSMENVLVMDRYIENIKSEDNEWDVITNICQKAIKRKGLSQQQVHEISLRILNEVRNK